MQPSLAYNLTRRDIPWRHDMFSDGLRAAGYEVMPQGKSVPQGAPGNVLLIWNRYGDFDRMATDFEKQGGAVIVAENGYLRGPKDSTLIGDYYALSLDGHNGSGRWPTGDIDGGRDYSFRWNALGIELKPWRPADVSPGHVLICPNRSFGTPGRIMPVDWAAQVARTLKKLTKREIRVRMHPGENQPPRPLGADLAGCWAMIVWYSSAGIHALIDGVPVICLAPAWIGKAAAETSLQNIEHPMMDDAKRLVMMQKLAWAQFSRAEIESGEPFLRLANRNGFAAASTR